MFDFSALQINSDEYSTTTVLFTFLLAFFLSSVIAITYEKTSRQVARPDYFIQALVLISIVAALVILAIGDSIAFGLGMIGALSIIRFRTTLRNPRNITFMFMSIAVGISCGVYGFMIAIVGTTAFCLAAFILRLTPFSAKNNMVGMLRFRLPRESKKRTDVETILKKKCTRWAMKKYRLFGGDRRGHLLEYEYDLKLKNEMEGWELRESIRTIEEIEAVRLFFENVAEEI